MALYKSDYGGYLARRIEGNTLAAFEAWASDGSQWWPYYLEYEREHGALVYYPLPYQVLGFSQTKVDQKPGTFTLGLCRCDSTQRAGVDTPWVLETRWVPFRRRVPAQQAPRWLKEHLARRGILLRKGMARTKAYESGV